MVSCFFFYLCRGDQASGGRWRGGLARAAAIRTATARTAFAGAAAFSAASAAGAAFIGTAAINGRGVRSIGSIRSICTASVIAVSVILVVLRFFRFHRPVAGAAFLHHGLLIKVFRERRASAYRKLSCLCTDRSLDYGRRDCKVFILKPFVDALHDIPPDDHMP